MLEFSAEDGSAAPRHLEGFQTAFESLQCKHRRLDTEW